MTGPSYKPGDYWMICDASGFKMRRSEAKKTWDGRWVRKDFWEPRHPQDFVKGKKDKQSVTPSRSDRPDVFVANNEVQPEDL
jgi:hypothetical protein